MKTTTLALVASGASGTHSPFTSAEVSTESLRSQNAVFTIDVDPGSTFDLDIEGCVTPGSIFHPIATLTQAGAILVADGTRLSSFVEVPKFPVMRVVLNATNSSYLQIGIRE